MTAAEYRAALAQLGLTTGRAAPVIGVSRRQSQYYAAGRTPIPLPVALLIEMLLKEISAKEPI